MIQLSAKMEEEDLNACHAILDNCIQDDPETLVARATVDFKEGNYELALEKYSEAFHMTGYAPALAYNIAICHYMLQQTDEAGEIINDIIERGIEQHVDFHPDATATIDNSAALEESFLVEAYNLKAAIAYKATELEEARAILEAMPTRNEQDLDAVTLHNDALFRIHDNADASFKKLSFLLENPPFPQATFPNLLILYCQRGYYGVAADILAENSNLTFDLLDQETYDFLDASIMIPASPDEAIKKFETLSKKYSTSIRGLKKDLEETKSSGNKESIEIIMAEMKCQMDVFMPVMMAHAKILWELEDYAMVEHLLLQNGELCSDRDEWRLNLAHALFVQQGQKFKESIKYYEPYVHDKGTNSLLDVSPIVLANLCVAYIMANRNEEAENIMEQVEKQEDASTWGKSNDDDNEVDQSLARNVHHSCIVNLVIGTLYCEKGNFEFGISRICKSLEPLTTKLGPDTWHYAKRCLLALADRAAKQMTSLKHDMSHTVLDFLDRVCLHGQTIYSSLQNEQFLEEGNEEDGPKQNTIAFEALKLKSLFVALLSG